MKSGDVVTFYPKWKSQKGKGIEVELIKFHKYFLNKRGGKPISFVQDDIKYMCEFWHCRMPDNTKQILKFRVIYEDLEHDEVGWNYNRTPNVIDYRSNSIVDTWEEILAGTYKGHIASRYTVNKHLGILQLKDKIIKKIASNCLKTVEKKSEIYKAMYLRYKLLTPSKRYYRLWNEIPIQTRTEVNETIKDFWNTYKQSKKFIKELKANNLYEYYSNLTEKQKELI